MSRLANEKATQSGATCTQHDVVVVGAGPYGLSVAAHLLGRGLDVAVFGKVLELWLNHMPKGMFLRSHWWASNLSTPHKVWSFEHFLQSSHHQACYPMPIETFIDYALWFQQQAVPNVDETYVSTIERDGDRFLLTLVDGRRVRCSTVVMAIGLYYYAHRPQEYAHLSTNLVSHSFDHGDFRGFQGKRVIVIGGGQGAIESSALLHEIGATVHVVARHPITWLTPDRMHERTLVEQILAPNAGIAPGWKNWALEYLPYSFYRFPQHEKDRFIRNHYVAAASDWLRGRVLGNVVLHEGQTIISIAETAGKVQVVLSNGSHIGADHVMQATGYNVNIHRLPMLHSSLREQIQTDRGSPLLNSWFESCVPGLYFVGLTALRSFGPLYRFVVGCKATAPRVASAVARRVKAGK